MRLKYSTPKNVPYIEFDDGNKLIFTTILEDKDKGFHSMTFSGKSISSICVSGKRAKVRRYIDTSEVITFATDMKFNNLDKRIKGKNETLSPVTLGFLKKVFNKLAPGGWMSREALWKLEKVFDKMNNVEEDMVDEDITANGDEW